jgi:hypothetical protein
MPSVQLEVRDRQSAATELLSSTSLLFRTESKTPPASAKEQSIATHVLDTASIAEPPSAGSGMAFSDPTGARHNPLPCQGDWSCCAASSCTDLVVLPAVYCLHTSQAAPVLCVLERGNPGA